MSNPLSPEYKALIEGLIEKHLKEWSATNRAWASYDITGMMSELITLLSPEWVSVKTERPKYYERVLCIDGYSQVSLAWMASDGEKDIWTVELTSFVLKNVTHWMPLPTPPKQ